MINEIANPEEFNNLITSQKDKLNIIFAYGKGCGPCADTKPKYEMVVNYFLKLGANINFNMMNMWDPINREFSKEMGVKGVPTFWGYYDEKRIWQATGGLDAALQKQAILSVIDSVKLNYGVTV